MQVILGIKSKLVQTIHRLALLVHNNTTRQNVIYATKPNRQLDIYTTSIQAQGSATKPKPAVVVVHGGGWIAGDKRERASFCVALAEAGYAVFSVNYRLAPQHPFPAPVTDCLLALNWVSEHAHEYGANHQSMSIIGDSAGAHIASLAVADKDDILHYGVDASDARRWIGKLILYYGIYNLPTVWHVKRPFMRMYLRAFTNKKDISQFPQAASASPIAYASEFPSTLLIASEKDPLHTQTIELARAMKAANVSHETVLLGKQVYPRADHGFQALPHSRAAKDSFVTVLEFLER